MEYLNYIYVFIFGLIFASFLNALGYRMDKGYKYPDIFIKSSACEKCKAPLKWYELIPILGYLLNKGKCSKCNTKINLYYPISELLLGITFLVLFMTHSPFMFYILAIVLFLLSYFDITTMSIPKDLTDKLLVSFLVYKVLSVFVALSILSVKALAPLDSIVEALFTNTSSLILSSLILTTVVIINRWKEILGLGDLLVLLIISAVLPFDIFVLYLYLTILISGFIAISMVLINKTYLKRYIPLLPFLALSFTITIIANHYFPHLLKLAFPMVF